MKPFFKIIFVLIPLLSFSQHYHFNRLTNYKSEGGFNKENAVFSNKFDDTYFLRIKEHHKNKIAYLSDLQRFVIHYFKVTEKPVNENEVFFQFDYSESVKLTKRNLISVFEFKTLKKDSTSSTVIMTEYKNKKKKKIINKARLNILNDSINSFSLFRFSFLHPHEERKKVNFIGPGFVESYTELDSKNPITIKFDYLKEVNLELEVPK